MKYLLLITIISAALSTTTDFLSLNENLKDLPTCLSDLTTIVKDGAEIVADFKSFNILGAIKEIKELVSVAQKLPTDCKLSIPSDILITKEGNYGDITHCI